MDPDTDTDAEAPSAAAVPSGDGVRPRMAFATLVPVPNVLLTTPPPTADAAAALGSCGSPLSHPRLRSDVVCRGEPVPEAAAEEVR